jgi:hypothetical protein
VLKSNPGELLTLISKVGHDNTDHSVANKIKPDAEQSKITDRSRELRSLTKGKKSVKSAKSTSKVSKKLKVQ